jgi:hypothetical protein
VTDRALTYLRMGQQTVGSFLAVLASASRVAILKP